MEINHKSSKREHVFPDYIIRESSRNDKNFDVEYCVEVFTYLRKKYYTPSQSEEDGDWWLIPIRTRGTTIIRQTLGDYDDLAKEEFKDVVLKRFFSEVYKCILFYKLDDNIIDPITSRPLIYKDYNQESEEKRLGLYLEI